MSAPVLGPSSNEKGLSKEQTESNSPTSDSDSEIQSVTPEYGSYHNHVFASPSVAEYWRQVYEKAQYEGRHRFDPLFTWTAEEEKRVRRKIDLRIITWAWMMFMALDLNRRNINRGSST
ncbi:hypothetical protein ONS95_008815 [Cadophora gregata]|uniref:uncharacterized protein n=1 Tax=Cadophora gregata TaxID=51156 RepID=UPI0026DCD1F5|nr:uncharacterized protein ONS95_008815 [Cadophora gregata]KAK0123819.1 hypothetical protein ONS95_008815 [Cadophora gregata]KAK0130163.1 hypothetical protein ONS96_000686 [Cadophora gregata f. sp. sojae]